MLDPRPRDFDGAHRGFLAYAVGAPTKKAARRHVMPGFLAPLKPVKEADDAPTHPAPLRVRPPIRRGRCVAAASPSARVPSVDAPRRVRSRARAGARPPACGLSIAAPPSSSDRPIRFPEKQAPLATTTRHPSERPFRSSVASPFLPGPSREGFDTFGSLPHADSKSGGNEPKAPRRLACHERARQRGSAAGANQAMRRSRRSRPSSAKYASASAAKRRDS
jgi:hypothetical protein